MLPLLFEYEEFMLMTQTEINPNLNFTLCIMLLHKGIIPMHALARYTTRMENIFASATQLQLN